MVGGALLIAFGALVSSADGQGAPAQPPASKQVRSQATDTADAENRQAVTQFATCVVKKHRREAAQLVLSLGVNHATAQTIADPDCATVPMSLSPATLQAALADVLVDEEFPTYDSALIEGAPALEQPALNESVFAPKPGKTYSPEELQKLEKTKVALRAGIAFWQFGECVVRSGAAGAHALLMTKVASAEEAAAIQGLRPVFARCPGLSNDLDNPSDLRGTIAENYYRLAHCGRDTLEVACDPNRP